jgi:tRNA dimethylallyltransferase
VLGQTPGGLEERIALVGPTAAGKTAVGIALAARLGAEIVSADSMQVYRLMDIGTAKPTPEEQRQVVFHAIDVANPDEEWTLADYQRLGDASCHAIAGQGKVPLIVGGTGLYIRALTTILDIPVAPPDEDYRAQWREFTALNGNAALLAEVARIDPDTAARLHINDIGRQIRALEVHAATGRTLTELHTENRAKQPAQTPLLFGLHYTDRELLYARIETRVDQMLAEGLLGEVRGLLAQGYRADLKPMLSLGYRHLAAYLAGEWDLETAVATMKQDTRRFAKRQLIWFRADPRIHWLAADGKSAEQVADEISTHIQTQWQHKGDLFGNEQNAA